MLGLQKYPGSSGAKKLSIPNCFVSVLNVFGSPIRFQLFGFLATLQLHTYSCDGRILGMYEGMNAWMHGCMDVWMYGCMDAWMYGCMDVWMYGCMDAWMYGCMDVWMYGCMDVWMHGCMHVNPCMLVLAKRVC